LGVLVVRGFAPQLQANVFFMLVEALVVEILLVLLLLLAVEREILHPQAMVLTVRLIQVAVAVAVVAVILVGLEQTAVLVL
jgi:hypothetical protein